MKTSLLNILCDIVYKNYNYCYLCLQEIDNNALRVDDEIALETEHKTIHFEKIVNIIGYVFNSEKVSCCLSCDFICKTCQQKALGAYKFMKRCRKNWKQLMEIVSSMLHCLPELNQKPPCSSLFVSINTKKLTAMSQCDAKKHVIKTKNEALKRFQKLQDIKTKTGRVKELLKNNNKSPSSNVKDVVKHEPFSESANSESVDILTTIKSDLECKKCQKKLSTSYHLSQHYIRVHEPKIFQCPKNQCQRRYGSESLLKEHLKQSHTCVICSLCGKTYDSKFSLKSHEMIHHSARVVCTKCGRTYKHWKTLKTHVCQQKETRPNFEAKFTCDYCNKRFTHKHTLRTHIQFQHGNGKSHACPWCNKKFYAQSRLKSHVVTHTQEKKFCCSICGGKFVTKESLVYHTRIHTGEKPFQCNFCEEKFISTSRRADHVRNRHMSASYECDICFSNFKGKSCLLRHRKRHLNPKSRLHNPEHLAKKLCG